MILSVINQKGGVGKTTTALNLAASLAQWGHPTLLVDLDPQGNATSGVGLSGVGLGGLSLYKALVSLENGGANAPAPRPAILNGPLPGLSVIGASPELAGSEIDLAGNERRDGLKRLLVPLKEEFSFVIVDTPPSLSLLTVNSLVCADRLIIPVQCEYFALEGLGQLLRTLEKIRRFLNPTLSVMGLVRTMFDPRVALSGQVSAELERHFPQLLFKTLIPRNVRLAEAPSFGKPIALHDKRSAGADAYRRLARETWNALAKSPRVAPQVAQKPCQAVSKAKLFSRTSLWLKKRRGAGWDAALRRSSPNPISICSTPSRAAKSRPRQLMRPTRLF